MIVTVNTKKFVNALKKAQKIAKMTKNPTNIGLIVENNQIIISVEGTTFVYEYKIPAKAGGFYRYVLPTACVSKLVTEKCDVLELRFDGLTVSLYASGIFKYSQRLHEYRRAFRQIAPRRAFQQIAPPMYSVQFDQKTYNRLFDVQQKILSKKHSYFTCLFVNIEHNVLETVATDGQMLRVERVPTEPLDQNWYGALKLEHLCMLNVMGATSIHICQDRFVFESGVETFECCLQDSQMPNYKSLLEDAPEKTCALNIRDVSQIFVGRKYSKDDLQNVHKFDLLEGRLVVTHNGEVYEVPVTEQNSKDCEHNYAYLNGEKLSRLLQGCEGDFIYNYCGRANNLWFEDVYKLTCLLASPMNYRIIEE